MAGGLPAEVGEAAVEVLLEGAELDACGLNLV